MGLTKILIDKATGLLNIRTLTERKYFDIPISLKALRAAAGKIIQGILDQLMRKIMDMLKSLDAKQLAILGLAGLAILGNKLTDDDIKKIVKSNKILRDFNKKLGLRVNEEIAPEVTIACFNEDFLNNKVQKMETALSQNPLDADNYLKISLEQSDFDEKTSLESKYEDLENLYELAQTILPWLLLAYNLFLQIKDFILSNRLPSTYRGNYLQNLIRQFGLILKKSGLSLLSTGKAELDALIKPFKTIDNLIIGLSMASFIYLKNRGIGQKTSSRQLEEISVLNTCEPFVPSFDVSINSTDISINLEGFTCPVPDDVIVPHIPISKKLEDMDSCDIEIEEFDGSISADPISDTANNAILQNLSPNEEFTFFLKRDQQIEFTNPIGQIGDSLIYSPVTGFVNKIEKNKIWIRDISDVGSTLLEDKTTDLKALYEELNQSNRMIKDFYLMSWYAPMLASTPFVDPSSNNLSILNKSILKRWKKVMRKDKRLKKSFNKDAQKITGKNNIKTAAENNDLNSIKIKMDKLEDDLLKNLNLQASKGINKAKITKIKKEDLVYFDWLLDIIDILVRYDDQNKLIISYTNQLNIFLLDRFFIEKYNIEKIYKKIDDSCKELDLANFSFNTLDYYSKMTSIYLKNNKNKNPLKSVKDYVIELGKNNKKLGENEKSDLVKSIMNLFLFSRNILSIQNNEKEYSSPKNINTLSFEEGNYIKNFFGTLNKRLIEIPDEIRLIEKSIDELADSYVPPSIITIENEQYEWYGLKGEKNCPTAEDNEEGYLSPNTAYDQGDIEYWLKYSGFATLASVTNPLKGWATGFPPPIGPLKLPVVYIPFKSFMTKWGFIVVGLTICGVFPFPWVLFGNLSAKYNTPIGDPLASIKNEIQALKKELSKLLKIFKVKTLEDYLKRQSKKIEGANKTIDDKKGNKRKHKLNKPIKDRSKTKPADKQSQILELSNWNKTLLIYTEEIETLKLERFVLETKYKLVYDVLTDISSIKGNPVDPKLKTIQTNEKTIEDQFNKLNALVDQLDQILIPLPIAMKPDTANFALTAKNPKPIIKIKEKVAPEVKTDIVQGIIDKSNIESSDFMSSKFGDKVNNSLVGNFDKYKSKLNLAKYTMVPQEAFPKYENLTPTNIAWLPFLYNDFVVKGAQSFGIPGQLPLPIG